MLTPISSNLLEKLESECNMDLITLEDLSAESKRLGLPTSVVIELLFEYLIDYRFTSEGS